MGTKHTSRERLGKHEWNTLRAQNVRTWGKRGEKRGEIDDGTRYES